MCLNNFCSGQPNVCLKFENENEQTKTDLFSIGSSLVNIKSLLSPSP